MNIHTESLIGKIFFDIYKIIKKIGQGSFGRIYCCENIITNEYFAAKIEEKTEKETFLKTESLLLKYLKGPGIPILEKYGCTEKYYLLIEQLLGKSLEVLFTNSHGNFNIKDVAMIGIQVIDRLEHIHSKFIIHRDIKPDNFVIGKNENNKTIFLIDYGLAKKYRSSRTMKHIEFRLTRRLTGTARYASINALRGGEQSRRDDLESTAYMLLYFLKGNLPWKGVSGVTKAEKYKKIFLLKKNISPDELCENLPNEFKEFYLYTKNLEFEEDPDYNFCRGLFNNVLKRLYNSDNDLNFMWCKEINLFNTIFGDNKMNLNNSNNNKNDINDINDINDNNNKEKNEKELVQDDLKNKYKIEKFIIPSTGDISGKTLKSYGILNLLGSAKSLEKPKKTYKKISITFIDGTKDKKRNNGCSYNFIHNSKKRHNSFNFNNLYSIESNKTYENKTRNISHEVKITSSSSSKDKDFSYDNENDYSIEGKIDKIDSQQITTIAKFNGRPRISRKKINHCPIYKTNDNLYSETKKKSSDKNLIKVNTKSKNNSASKRIKIINAILRINTSNSKNDYKINKQKNCFKNNDINNNKTPITKRNNFSRKIIDDLNKCTETTFNTINFQDIKTNKKIKFYTSKENLIHPKIKQFSQNIYNTSFITSTNNSILKNKTKKTINAFKTKLKEKPLLTRKKMTDCIKVRNISNLFSNNTIEYGNSNKKMKFKLKKFNNNIFNNNMQPRKTDFNNFLKLNKRNNVLLNDTINYNNTQITSHQADNHVLSNILSTKNLDDSAPKNSQNNDIKMVIQKKIKEKKRINKVIFFRKLYLNSFKNEDKTKTSICTTSRDQAKKTRGSVSKTKKNSRNVSRGNIDTTDINNFFNSNNKYKSLLSMNNKEILKKQKTQSNNITKFFGKNKKELKTKKIEKKNVIKTQSQSKKKQSLFVELKNNNHNKWGTSADLINISNNNLSNRNSSLFVVNSEYSKLNNNTSRNNSKIQKSKYKNINSLANNDFNNNSSTQYTINHNVYTQSKEKKGMDKRRYMIKSGRNINTKKIIKNCLCFKH